MTTKTDDVKQSVMWSTYFFQQEKKTEKKTHQPDYLEGFPKGQFTASGGKKITCERFTPRADDDLDHIDHIDHVDHVDHLHHIDHLVSVVTTCCAGSV